MSGDGGQLVVWSDNTTEFYGSIFARGGKNSGNGGTVQICGVNSLINQGNVDVLQSVDRPDRIWDVPN